MKQEKIEYAKRKFINMANQRHITLSMKDVDEFIIEYIRYEKHKDLSILLKSMRKKIELYRVVCSLLSQLKTEEQ